MKKLLYWLGVLLLSPILAFATVYVETTPNGDGRFADDLVRIVSLNPECRARVAQPFEPSAQPQGRSRRDRPTVVDADGAADHHLTCGVDVQLHLSDADGVDHSHQVAGGEAFAQALRILASVRKPRKERLRRLVDGDGVGLFKEYLADALMVHGDSGIGLSKSGRLVGGRSSSMLLRPAGIPNPPQRTQA